MTDAELARLNVKLSLRRGQRLLDKHALCPRCRAELRAALDEVANNLLRLHEANNPDREQIMVLLDGEQFQPRKDKAT